MAELADKRKFYIDGAWVAPATPNDLEVIDPTTEEPVAVISVGAQADTDRAVAAAKAAGCAGIVLGKALLDGRFALGDAIALAPGSVEC